jgi:hypothetical protein
MARPKRMGAFNALDELLPGPERPRQERTPERPPFRRLGARRARARNALDDLLPGPGWARPTAPEPGRGGHPAGRALRPKLEAVADPPAAGRQRHLDAWNPLDGLPAAPAGEPTKTRMTLRVPAELAEAARDAVAHLSAGGDRETLGALAERALRAELARLAAERNAGRPFPPRR